ncbi:MAG: AMP-binding protein, partial [Flammeovirgaceae bacterium]
MEKVGEQKHQPIHSLNFLTDEEKQNFSQPGSHPDDKSVLSEIIANSQRSPRRTAISWKGEKITYQELISRASAIAVAFHSVRADLEGRIICVSLDRSADLIASILAIWKVGAIY